MKWLDKLLRRGGTHEEWLAQNPGKRSLSMPASTDTDAASRQRMRDQMEGEMAGDAQRTQARNAAQEADKPSA